MKTLLTTLAVSLCLVSCSDITSAVSGKEKASADTITIDGMTLEYANMPDEPLEKPLEIVKEPKVVAMTSTMTVAVKADGTLWTWGSNANGELLRETKTREEGYTPGQVEGVNDAVAVSANSHILVLKKDGTVWGWGVNGDGQINPQIKSNAYKPLTKMIRINGLKDVIDIAASTKNSFFLTKNGDVYAQGANGKGWIDNNASQYIELTKVEGLSNIVRIDMEANLLLALNANGEVFSLADRKSILGRSVDKNTDISAEKIKIDKPVVDIATGSGFGMVLLNNGKILAWGTNVEGRIAQEKINRSLEPIQIDSLSKVVNIGASTANTADGSIYTWGGYIVGNSTEPMDSRVFKLRKPIKLSNKHKVISFVRAPYISSFVTSDGELFFWEGNPKGRRGDRTNVESFHAKYVFTPEKSLWNYYN